jgi:hypothetical protein
MSELLLTPERVCPSCGGDMYHYAGCGIGGRGTREYVPPAVALIRSQAFHEVLAVWRDGGTDSMEFDDWLEAKCGGPGVPGDAIRLADALAAVEVEEELPGEPPPEMLAALRVSDTAALVEGLRIAVRLTKRNIATRLRAAVAAPTCPKCQNSLFAVCAFAACDYNVPLSTVLRAAVAAPEHDDCATMEDVTREVFCRVWEDGADAAMEEWRAWYKPSDWLWWGRGVGAFIYQRNKRLAEARAAVAAPGAGEAEK